MTYCRTYPHSFWARTHTPTRRTGQKTAPSITRRFARVGNDVSVVQYVLHTSHDARVHFLFPGPPDVLVHTAGKKERSLAACAVFARSKCDVVVAHSGHASPPPWARAGWLTVFPRARELTTMSSARSTTPRRCLQALTRTSPERMEPITSSQSTR